MGATANRLFELFQHADYAQAAATFSPGARVYTRYGPGGSGEGISYREFEQAAALGAVARVDSAVTFAPLFCSMVPSGNRLILISAILDGSIPH